MAFVASIAAIGTAVGAVATVAAVATVVSEVGIVLSVVGAVTGDSGLKKLGGEMAMVGGVASVVAGGIGAMDGVLSSSASDAALAAAPTGAEGGLAVTSDAAATGAADLSAAPTGAEAGLEITSMPDATTAATPATMDVSSGQNLAQNQAANNSMADKATLDSSAQPTGATQQAPTVQTPATKDLSASANAPTVNTPADATTASSNYWDTHQAFGPPSSLANQSSDSFWSSFSDFANKNHTLFNSGMQLVGGALNGMNQRDINDQNAALKQQQINQTSYGSAVGSMTPSLSNGIISGVRK